MELQIEKDDPKFTRPAQSSLYRPEVALAFFKAYGTPESVAAGKPVFVENEGSANIFSEGPKMYLLVDGEVALTVDKKPIGAVAKGEIFGEMASISHLPRSATATAKSACSLIAMSEKQFQGASSR
jgi:CRP-like cAMP-binding protein